MVRVWRRSLQVRVGTTTVVVAGIMVFLIGLFLVDKVFTGVLKTKRDAAVRQANLGLPVAQSVLAQIDAGVYAEVGAAAQQIGATLTAGGTSAGLFSLGIGSVSDNVNREPLNVGVPLSLREVVQDGNPPCSSAGASAPQFEGARAGTHRGRAGEGPDGLFELYYQFPLTAEQQTIHWYSARSRWPASPWSSWCWSSRCW